MAQTLLEYAYPLHISRNISNIKRVSHILNTSANTTLTKRSCRLFSTLALSSYTPKFRKPPFLASASASTSTMASPSKKVLVPIANGSEPMETIITIDILRRAGADVTVASVEKSLQVDACHGVKIIADSLISDCADTKFDLISLPGGMPGAATLRDCKLLEDMMKRQAADGRLFAAICASPAVALGSWGMLKGLKATCYPSFMDQLSSSANAVESRVQQDGKAITSRGPGTTMEYSVALVEQLFGKEKANEVSGPLVMRSNHGDEYTFTEFNPVNWKFDTVPKVLVPIANGSEEMEAVIIIDVLRRAKCDVVVASVQDKLEILASRKVTLVADMVLSEAVKFSYDLVVLPVSGSLFLIHLASGTKKLVVPWETKSICSSLLKPLLFL
ncbi:hypothetical protein Leryth_022759 [Lithospermum erythrorhizon]|nr:hypothetical protein Leryth_022759 [Lithospermum erythrorhizon]